MQVKLSKSPRKKTANPKKIFFCIIEVLHFSLKSAHFVSANLAKTSYELEKNFFEDIESLGRTDQPLDNNLSPIF